MTLLLSRCESIVLHALGMSSLPAEVSVLECVNRAGSWLCSHPWKWLERTSTVSTSIGVEYVNLPSDARAIVSASVRNYGMEPSSLDEIRLRRTLTTATSTPLIFALADSLSAAGVFTKRLELFPTPSTVTPIGIYYRAGWQEPLAASGDAARIAVPLDWEGVFIEALIAYAMGTEERDIAGVSARLEALRVSEMFAYLVRQDGMSQSNYGTMRGGGVAMQMGRTWEMEIPLAVPPS